MTDVLAPFERGGNFYTLQVCMSTTVPYVLQMPSFLEEENATQTSTLQMQFKAAKFPLPVQGRSYVKAAFHIDL